MKIVCNTYEFDKKCGININDIDGFTVSSINYMMGGPSGGGRTGMKKTGLLKRAGVAVMTADRKSVV